MHMTDVSNATDSFPYREDEEQFDEHGSEWQYT